MVPNDSATGGYLVSTTSQALPGGLTLTQFIQTVLVGVSALPGTLVRPKWQLNPPKQPDVGVDWLAFAIVEGVPDSNAYVGMDADGISIFQRQVQFEIQCSFYGPNAQEIAGLVRDGFQIQQNVEALRAANMGYAAIAPARSIPDLVNERWVNRVEQTVFLRRQIQRSYPILPIVSAEGTIHTVLGDEEYLLNFETSEEES